MDKELSNILKDCLCFCKLCYYNNSDCLGPICRFYSIDCKVREYIRKEYKKVGR